MWFEIKNVNQNPIMKSELDIIIDRAKKAGIKIFFDEEKNRLELSIAAIKNITYKLITCGEIRRQLQYKEKKSIYMELNMSKDTFYRTLRAMNNEKWPDESYFSNLYH